MTPALEVRAEAPVMEVFASIQGEGRYVGEPQVFLRLSGCPLRCAWCDTPASWDVRPDAKARVRDAGGEAGTRREPATATPFQAMCWVASAEPAGPRTLSITGGEPLLWPEFVLGLASVAGERRLHLETAGAHPEALERVLEVLHHVSLDLKLPADLAPPVAVAVSGELVPSDEAMPRDAEHWRRARRACLSLVRGRDACCKVVLRGGRTAADYRELLEDHAELASDVPLFLQPVTPLGSVTAADPGLMSDVAEEARELGLVVRVVPQVHRALGIA